MVAPVNDFDLHLQSESPRTLAPRGGIVLSATANVVSVAGGVGTPSVITLVATPLNLPGTPTFAMTPSVPFTLDATGHIATLRYGDMGTSNIKVDVTLVSGGITYTDTTTVSQVSFGSLGYTGAANATANSVTRGVLSARPAGADGDFYFGTDTLTLYQKVGGSWQAAGTNVTDTSQIADGAGLGTKAVWTGVTGTGKPADNATVGATLGVNVSGQITSANAAQLVNIPNLQTFSMLVGTLQTATGGGRTQIKDNLITVFDTSSAPRVKIGNTSLSPT